MQLRAVALVAGMGFNPNQLHQRVAAQVMRQLPGLGLVQPHQRRVDAQAALQPQVQRQLLGLHGVVAAIGVAGVIGLAHAGDDHRQPTAISQRARQCQKQQIAARHKGVGQAIGLHGKGHIIRQRRAANLLEHIQRQHMVLAQPRSPLGKALRQLLAHRGAHSHLDTVALPVVKTQRFHTLKHGQRLRQAGRGVLTAREQHQRALVMACTGDIGGRICRRSGCICHRAAITSPLRHPC